MSFMAMYNLENHGAHEQLHGHGKPHLERNLISIKLEPDVHTFDLLNLCGSMPNLKLLNTSMHTHTHQELNRFPVVAATPADIFLNYFCTRFFPCLLLLHPQFPASRSADFLRDIS